MTRSKFVLTMPSDLLRSIDELCSRRGLTRADYVQRCLMIGFLVDDIDQSSDAQLLVEQNGKISEILNPFE